MILLQGQPSTGFFIKLIELDRSIFFKINRDWHSGLLDSIALIIRESFTWIPLYVFLLIFTLMNFGKKAWWWVVSILVTAGLSDLISSHVVKPFFNRPRPCRNEEIASQVRFLARVCGLNGSFTSSHAANHFAIAMFLFLTLRFTSNWWSIFFLWAACICYAQVYVGVHYPSDILGGAVLGCLIGGSMGLFFNKKIGLSRS